MSNAIDLTNKTAFFLVTGSSRGIGKTMAIETSKNFASGSVVVLLARSLSGLEATKSEILASNPDLKVFIKSIDLTQPSVEEIDQILIDSLANSPKFDLAIVIHNVGTLGDVSKWSSEIENYSLLNDYFSTNVFAPTILNNRALKALPGDIKKIIVNITSKAAIAPFKSFTYYCMGKAAREMYFRCLAEEFPSLLVLNYSPGPVESDMTVYAQESSVSAEVSGMFKNLRDHGTILTTEMTTKKFLEVIKAGKYKSGDHVDYYDEL